jgi:Tol biopolymer transport system component
VNLIAGTKLGPYEVVAPLGAGGMGEVYRARDTRLERTVAIKILPAQFCSDPVRKQRFEREAKTISSLNHPHICTLHDIGSQDGIDYLVMECLEGETLAKRLEKGPLPLEQLLKFGAQIADALDKAHHSGVVHRDLKPGNIILTPTGAKLLDFGLAKPVSPLANLATLTATKQASPVTEEGAIIGTFQYMSPEQVEGRELDGRSDIFSLGAVLYEMLTGQRAFQGKSQLSIASAILEKEPEPISKLKPMTPPALDFAIRKSLAKLPEERWQSASDFGSQLKWIAESGLQARVGVPGIPLRNVRARLTQAVAVVFAVVAAIASWVAWHASPPKQLPLMQLDAELTPGTALVRGLGGSLALSPDGKLLALVLRGPDGQVRLGTRRLDESQLTMLAGTEEANAPFFSPDGRWIAFSAGTALKKISAEGGAPVTLCDARSLGGSWGDDGTIVASLGVGVGLSRIPAGGGEPVPLTKVNRDKGEITHRWPQVLPGSQAVLFTVYAGSVISADDSDIDVVSLKTGERKTVYHGGFFARYLPSGHLVFVHQNTLFAAPFDLKRLALIGSPQPIVEVVRNQFDEGGYFDFSHEGEFVYVSGKAELPRSIFWMDASGQTKPLQSTPGLYSFPKFSPDGKRLAFSLDDGQGHTDIWVHNLERNTTARLTSVPGRNTPPVWTPDGKGIVFSNFSGSHSAIYWIRSDGSREAQRMTNVENQWRPQAISPDGKWLAVIEPAGSGGVPILTVPIEGEPTHPRLGNAISFLETPFITISPAFSPDGRWIVYRSGEPGKRGIWVRPFPGPGGQWQVSAGADEFPIWSRNGHQLFFLTDNRIMVADYTATGDSFVAGKPRVWSEKRLLDLRSPPVLTYDAAPDGKRFAVVLYADGTAEEKPITHVTFLLNFFDELRRRVHPE